MGLAPVTELLVVVAVVVVVVDDPTVVEELVVGVDAVDEGAATLLLVGTDFTIEDIGVVVLAGAASGLNGVFCFCMLYIRLGHKVTRISRPNSSLPRGRRKVSEGDGMGAMHTIVIIDCRLS
jgi:hypothetical protein